MFGRFEIARHSTRLWSLLAWNARRSEGKLHDVTGESWPGGSSSPFFRHCARSQAAHPRTKSISPSLSAHSLVDSCNLVGSDRDELGGQAASDLLVGMVL
jgi:hypothetical protein